jgi:peroxiredoxin Q/BCP
MVSPYSRAAGFAQPDNPVSGPAGRPFDSLDTPPKATKGRRMSKKTLQKSGKTASRTPASPTARKTAGKAETAKTASPKSAASKRTSDKAGTGIAKPAASPAKPAAKIAHATAALKAGDAAPAFTLPRDGGQPVALADYAGRQLVIFFYPRANTPGCTLEAMDFSRLAKAFAASGTAVLGVSADSLKAQESFRDKHELTVPLLSDEKLDMLGAYGVWAEKSMYGKTFMGIVRTTILIDRRGRIARIWSPVKVDGHAEDVLVAARQLGG